MTLTERESRFYRYAARVLVACVRLELREPFQDVLAGLVGDGVREAEARRLLAMGFAEALRELTEQAARGNRPVLRKG